MVGTAPLAIEPRQADLGDESLDLHGRRQRPRVQGLGAMHHAAQARDLDCDAHKRNGTSVCASVSRPTDTLNGPESAPCAIFMNHACRVSDASCGSEEDKLHGV